MMPLSELVDRIGAFVAPVDQFGLRLDGDGIHQLVY